MHRTGVLCLLLLFAAGCGELPPVELDTSGVKPAVDYSDLSAVLAKSVDSDGRVIPARARSFQDRLDAQLRRLALTGPTATPRLFADQDAALAYWYNARAAWSLKLALLADLPRELPEPQMRRSFPLDGRRMSIGAIDEQIHRLFGWRAAVAAPCVCEHRAPMPKEAFAPEPAGEQIDRRFNDFVADRRRFVIDVESKQVRVPHVLWSFREEVMDDYLRAGGSPCANLLSALVAQTQGRAQRRLQDAIGYAVVPQGQSSILAILKD